jgi:cell division protein FtsN
MYFIVSASPAARSVPPVAAPSAGIQQSNPRNMAMALPPGIQDTARYRVQVGAYQTRANAQEAFNRVAGAGFSPAFEEHQGFIRVLISGVRGNEMRETVERLYNAGFKEILLQINP